MGIEERPAIVETNTQLGHWEGDTVIGADHDGVLLTLVERVTKYTLIVKLPSKQAVFLATHLRMSRKLKVSIYFARPYHSCGPPLRERALNENTNGLIREYIPKGCRISSVRPKDVHWVEHQLNHRPRKTVGFLSPIQFALKHGIALQT